MMCQKEREEGWHPMKIILVIYILL